MGIIGIGIGRRECTHSRSTFDGGDPWMVLISERPPNVLVMISKVTLCVPFFCDITAMI